MIGSYSDLIKATQTEQEPQRLLFVFCRAELPDDASAEERVAFEQGEGGALTPVICVDKIRLGHVSNYLPLDKSGNVISLG